MSYLKLFNVSSDKFDSKHFYSSSKWENIQHEILPVSLKNINLGFFCIKYITSCYSLIYKAISNIKPLGFLIT